MHSVGVGDRRLHTDGAVELDLSSALARTTDGSIRTAADPAEEEALSYIKGRGFIDDGQLQELDETYVTAQELRHAASELGRRISVTEEEEYYFLELVEGAQSGKQPPPDAVPSSMEHARGLGAVAAVRAYREDLRTWMDHETSVEEVRVLLGSVDAQRRRIRALDGAVPPTDADRLVAAARGLGAYLRTEGKEDTSLDAARKELEALSQI